MWFDAPRRKFMKSQPFKVAFGSAKVAQGIFKARYFRGAKGDYDEFTAYPRRESSYQYRRKSVGPH